MKIKSFPSLLLALLITTCISPMASTGKGDKIQAPSSAPTIGATVQLAPTVGATTQSTTSTGTTTQPAPTTGTVPPSSPSAATVTYIPLLLSHKTSTPPPPGGSGIVADHTVIALFSSIPNASISNAAGLKTLFMHASTGNNIWTLGLQCLSGVSKDPSYWPQECTDLAANYPNYNPYDDRNWDWTVWNSGDAILKTDDFVSIVNSQQQNYQVIGMKYCYDDGWNVDFPYYRDHMLELERAYPNKIFIWSTSALWNHPGGACPTNGNNSCANIADFNQQLRAYAQANHKFLYDIADIESHDTNGNPCQLNGIESLCNEYADGFGGGGGGHPDVTGSIRLAKGFWWLMARISGWNGN
jgi:hypothetical protein